MSIKACVYKECENYSINNVPCGFGDFTVFQFPKEPERRQQWRELGQVLPRIPDKELYMCSNHFDKKFLSINSRRTVLLGVAIPFAYNGNAGTTTKESDQDHAAVAKEHSDNDFSFEDNENFVIASLNGDEDGDDHVDEDEYQVESTMQEDEDGNIIQYDDPDVVNLDKSIKKYDVAINCNTKSGSSEKSTIKNQTVSSAKIESYSRKRKPTEETETTQPKQTKIILNKINTDTLNILELNTQIEIKRKATNEPKAIISSLSSSSSSSSLKPKIDNAPTTPKLLEIDESDLVDTSKVTTFIFKGEEYVQMPKEHYMEEKRAVMRKISQYENILKTFKQSLNSIKFS